MAIIVLCCMGIPAQLFQILKDDAVKVLHSMWQQIWKVQPWPLVWKTSVFIPIPEKGNGKECSNYSTISFISHARKVYSKFSKQGFNSTWTENFQMFKLVLEKAEEIDIKCQHLLDHRKIKRVPEKHLLLLH